MPPKKYLPDFLTKKIPRVEILDPKKYVRPPHRVNFEFPPLGLLLHIIITPCPFYILTRGVTGTETGDFLCLLRV